MQSREIARHVGDWRFEAWIGRTISILALTLNSEYWLPESEGGAGVIIQRVDRRRRRVEFVAPR